VLTLEAQACNVKWVMWEQGMVPQATNQCVGGVGLRSSSPEATGI